MPPQRLPVVNADDGTWGDIIRQYIMKEHFNDDTNNAANGGHQKVTIRAGTASAGTAPLKFTTGTLLTTPEAGAIEFNGDNLYFTQTTGPTRKKLAAYDDASGATGDIYYRNSSGYFTRLAAGSSNDFLTIASGIPSWTANIVGKTFDNTNSITIRDANFTIQDDGDATKQLQFQLSGITTGTTRTLTIPNASGTIYVTGSTDVSVADGGTGRSTNTTAYGIIAAGTTATGAMQTIAPGTSGQFLKSAGASALASFASIQLSDLSDSSTVATLTGTQTLTSKTLTSPRINQINDTNGSTVLDLTAITSAVNRFYLTNQSTGNYPTFGVDGSDTNIGFTLAPKGNGPVRIYASAGQAPTLDVAGPDANLNLNLVPKGTGRVQAGGVTVPTISSSDTLTNKTISGSNNTISGLGLSSLSATGTPSASTYLRGDNTWATIAASGDASTNTATSVDSEVVLFSGTGGKTLKRATGTGIATLTSGVLSATATTGSGNVVLATTPTLTTPVLNGTITGTGVATAATANLLAKWDTNKNLFADNFIATFTTTPTAAGTTVLTVASTQIQVFTGTSTQIVRLPTTSVVAGTQYRIINNSTGAVTVQSSGANDITILAGGSSALFTALQATPTTAAHWDPQYWGSFIASGKAFNVSNTLTLAGTDGTTMTFPSASGTVATIAATQTLTAKTISLASNTITGTTAQFNAALSDNLFATQAGTETLTNKNLTSGTNTFPTFNQNTTGNAATATTATNQSGGTVSATTGTFSTYVSTDEIRNRTGSQLVINSGDAASLATGQTGELLYVNAESGLQINSSPDNWSGGWAGRVTTTIDSSGITWNGSTVWHAGNDGAGSGLDADTLDGQQASAFAATSHTHTAANISDSTTVGRAVLTATDAAAARTAIGAGTGTGDVTLNGVQTLTNKDLTGAGNTYSASNLTTGTLPDARLTGTYSGFTHKIDGSNTVFTTPNTGSTNTAGRTVYGLAEYRSNSATQVGAIIFYAPNTTSSIMHQLEISGLLYNQNIVRLTVQGYRTTGTWNDTRKISTGTVDVQVRWGVDPSGKNCLILGDVGTSWSYPHLTVARALFSHTGASDAYATGWTVGVVTDLTGFTQITSDIADSAMVGSITGNAATANTLQTARTIGGVSFNGSANINLPGVNTAGNQNTTGSAATLTTARTIHTNLASTSSASFNGSANITPGVTGTLPVGNGGTGAATLTGIVKGNGTSAFTAATAGTDYVTPTGTETLTNKTISGSNNTFNNIPASAITGLDTDVSKLVCSTVNGGIGTEDGANTWAKIATFSTGTSQFSECQLILTVANSTSANHATAIVSVYFRSNATSSNPTVDVEILAKGGNGNAILSDSFKVISGGWSTDMELWFKKGASYSLFRFYETTRSLNGGTLTYTTNPGWQSAVPTGVVNNISSDGIYAGLQLSSTGTISATQLISNVSTGTAPITVASTTKVTNLNADLLDDMNATSANTANTIVSRDSNGDFSGRYLMSAYVNMNHASSARTTDTVFYSSTDDYIRKNTAVGFKTSLALQNVDNTSDATKNSASATLTNKTISGASNTLSNIPQSAVTNLTTDLAGKAATSHTHTAANISDSTTVGRAVLTATDAAAARTAIGAGTGTGDVTLTGSETLTNKTLTSPVINGTITGTGVATAATANLLAKWDTNKNLFADNFIATFTTTPTAAGTTVLTVASTQIQVFTGTSTQIVRLPTTSVVAGTQYRIINNSTGAVTVQSSGGNQITILAGNTSGLFTSLQATPTAATHWDPQYWGSTIAASKTLNVSNTLTLAGTDGTTMTFPGASGTVATIAATQTLTAKTISLASNTITGTTAQFNAALSDNLFATQAGTETLTNKNLTSGTNTFPTFNQNTTGSAATLTTARTVQTNLASTSSASFNGSANITPGVTGTLPVGNGGTGATTLTGIVKGNGTGAFTAVAAPSGTIVGTTDTQTLSAKTLTTPTIADFTNATHTHTNAAGGGQINPLFALTTTGSPSSSTYLRGDNTWATISAGDVTTSGVQTLTNKRINPRIGTTASSATPVIDTDTVDQFTITALATNISSMSTALGGTPVEGQKLIIRIKDNGTPRGISWGASWRGMGVTLPIVTTASKMLYIGAVYNATDSIWDVIAVEQQA